MQNLGAKSAEKVKELLAKGFSERVRACETNPRTVALAEFSNVWGAGGVVAERWYDLGCRTIADVREKVEEKGISLSIQQQVGMKYYDEFNIPIPRAEIAEVEKIARAAVFDLIEKSGAPDPERTYCYATGSYIRGQSTSGDIDILIVLPPSMSSPLSPDNNCGAFLGIVLQKLRQIGLLVDEMGIYDPHGDEEKASWNGVCRLSAEKPHRRIDIKVYRNEHAPTALNYFANSTYFCRATRNYANYRVKQRAQAFNPDATGFKIADMFMVPMKRRYKGKKRKKKGDDGGGDGSGDGGDDGDDDDGGGVSGGSDPFEAVERRIDEWKESRKKEQWSGGGGGGAIPDTDNTIVLQPTVHLSCETDLYEVLGLSYVPPRMRVFPGIYE